MTRVTIDPVTRVEGHGRVEVILDEAGRVAEAYFIVPEFRGFERLCVGRPVEEMPGLTGRVCGICPEAHQAASAEALDRLFGVEPPPAARLIRELVYSAFVLSNQATHFFALAGPDFLLDGGGPEADRSVFAVLRRLGPEMAARVIEQRVRAHTVIEALGGRRVHPVAVLPGGWSRPVTDGAREVIRRASRECLAFADDCLGWYEDEVLPRQAGRLEDQTFTQRTHSMGSVDAEGRVAFMGGTHRVVDPEGVEVAAFEAADYLDHIDERVEPWTFVKLPYLRARGWTGLRDGASSGVYAVGPLARLNAARGFSTPRAQAACERLWERLGARDAAGTPRPIHNRLASHWVRLIDQLHAAERMEAIASAPALTDPEVRAALPPAPVTDRAVGSVEAPRGTLFHDYRVDARGMVTGVNLVVATTANHAAIALSVTAAARSVVSGGTIPPEGRDRIEMAIRAHDPCLSCATHTFGADTRLEVLVRDASGARVAAVRG